MSIDQYESIANNLIDRQFSNEQAKNFFKKVWALPSKIEETPYDLLSQGERRQLTIAMNGRSKAWDIYSASETQENIRGTAFGAWQAVVEYADHHASGGAERRAVATLSGRSDKIKDKALSLVLS